MRRFLPVIVLVLFAPVLAELLWGSTTISKAFVLIAELPMYGGGALLIRELVRRSGRGWGSIFLLGAAYGIVEEGLALQSFFNPTLYGASDWGARILGINGVYTVWAIGYHAVWSVAIPILLTELLFPARRDTPYLGKVGLVITAIFYVLGIGLIGLSAHSIPASAGYWASPLLPGLALLGVIALAIVALVILPPRTPEPPLPVNAPTPWLILLVTALSGFAWQFLLIWLKHFIPAITQGALVLLPLLGALAIAGVVIVLVRQWARARNWNDLHRLALVSGALIAHSVFGVLVLTQTTLDRVGLIILGLVMTILLALFAIQLRRTLHPNREHSDREQRGNKRFRFNEQ